MIVTQDKLSAVSQRHEAEKASQQSQITNYETELAHSHLVSFSLIVLKFSFT